MQTVFSFLTEKYRSTAYFFGYSLCPANKNQSLASSTGVVQLIPIYNSRWGALTMYFWTIWRSCIRPSVLWGLRCVLWGSRCVLWGLRCVLWGSRCGEVCEVHAVFCKVHAVFCEVHAAFCEVHAAFCEVHAVFCEVHAVVLKRLVLLYSYQCFVNFHTLCVLTRWQSVYHRFICIYTLTNRELIDTRHHQTPIYVSKTKHMDDSYFKDNKL